MPHSSRGLVAIPEPQAQPILPREADLVPAEPNGANTSKTGNTLVTNTL